MEATRCNQHGRVTGTYRKDATTKSTIMRLKRRDKPVKHDEYFGVNHFPARLQDSRGHFWAYADALREFDGYAGTWGTSEYDMLAGRWLNFTERGRDIPGAEARQPGSYVEAAAADIHGRMWYGTYEGGVAYRTSDNKWQYLTTDDGLACNSCWGIWCDDDGTMWYTSQAGAQSLDLESFRSK